MLKYAQTGSTDAAYNLSFEEYILTHKRQGDWLLLWQNSPTVVVGLNQVDEAEADLAYCAAHGVAVVRRATGGGAVYHDLGNLNYSLISDAARRPPSASRASCARLRSAALDGRPGRGHGTQRHHDRGAQSLRTAQRLYSGRVLHHGTLLFKTDREAMAAALRPAPDKFSGKAAKSVRSRVGEISGFLPRGTTLEGFRSALLAALRRRAWRGRSLRPGSSRRSNGLPAKSTARRPGPSAARRTSASRARAASQGGAYPSRWTCQGAGYAARLSQATLWPPCRRTSL